MKILDDTEVDRKLEKRARRREARIAKGLWVRPEITKEQFLAKHAERKVKQAERKAKKDKDKDKKNKG